jgi:hypothetical protein
VDLEDTLTEGEAPSDLDSREKMRWKVRTAEGRQVYAQRKYTVEPVFGQIKEARGFRRFLLRGLSTVEAEWGLVCTVHNILKLFRYAPAGAMAW